LRFLLLAAFHTPIKKNIDAIVEFTEQILQYRLLKWQTVKIIGDSIKNCRRLFNKYRVPYWASFQDLRITTGA